MIRPVQFRMNEQTAVNNFYQKTSENTLPDTVNAKATKEFDTMVIKLKKAGIHVIVVEDTKDFDTPDSIFPNNWISFHGNGYDWVVSYVLPKTDVWNVRIRS